MSNITVSITTSSEVIHYNNGLPAGTPPSIVINGNTLPSPGRCYYPTGFQVVVFDGLKPVTDPSSILANEYVFVPVGDSHWWMSTYSYMYQDLYKLILTSGNIDSQVRMLVSFGLDANMVPTPDVLNLMLNSGAGSILQNWITSVGTNQGSQADNPDSWVSNPFNYILVGSSHYAYGDGHEIYESKSGTTTLSFSVGN